MQTVRILKHDKPATSVAPKAARTSTLAIDLAVIACKSISLNFKAILHYSLLELAARLWLSKLHGVNKACQWSVGACFGAGLITSIGAI